MLTVMHQGSMIFHSIEAKLVTARLCGRLKHFFLSMLDGADMLTPIYVGDL